jgi:hypothetical protein
MNGNIEHTEIFFTLVSLDLWVLHVEFGKIYLG